MHLNQRHERPPLGLVTVDDPRLLPLPRPLLLLLPPLLLHQQRVHVDELGGAAAGPGLRKWKGVICKTDVTANVTRMSISQSYARRGP